MNLNLKSHKPSRAEEILRQSIEWVRTHREQFWAVTGTVAGGILLVVFMLQRRETENKEAWTQLGAAQGYLLQNQLEPAAKALEQWSQRFQGSSADAYAKFLRADLLYRTTDYVGAARVYTDLANTAHPAILRPLALSAASASQEMAGRLPEAQAAAQQFLENYPDHHLAASMYLAQARLSELTGNGAAAAALYDRYATLYPQSPWTDFAKARLAKLATPPVGSPPPTSPTPTKN